MSSFALLHSSILNSSIWIKESKETRLVWVTILASKDKDGVVLSSVVGLADRAKVTPDECREALRIFLAPDPDDTSKVEEGRRLREVPGGWQVVNNELYRFSNLERRELWRQQKEAQRAADALKKRKPRPLKGEVPYLKACEAGAPTDHLTGPTPEMEAKLEAEARRQEEAGL